MDTHLGAAGFRTGAADNHYGFGGPGGPLPPASSAEGSITPSILGTAGSPSILGSGGSLGSLDGLGTGGSSGASGSSLVNALQGLAQMLLGGGSSGSAGSGFSLSLPQYQPMQKPNQNDPSDIAPSPASPGDHDD